MWLAEKKRSWREYLQKLYPKSQGVSVTWNIIFSVINIFIMFIWIYVELVLCKSCFVNATETEMAVISIISPNTEVIYHYQVIIASPFSHAIYSLHLVNTTENLWNKSHPK